MLTISTKGRYGTRLMIRLAKNYEKEPLFLKTIAEQEEISQGYLEQILPMLKNAKLITSSRGANGGYSLTKLPQKITLKNIIEALEGPVKITECVDNPKTCCKHKKCPSRKIWCKLKKTITKTLEETTLKDLVDNHQY